MRLLSKNCGNARHKFKYSQISTLLAYTAKQMFPVQVWWQSDARIEEAYQERRDILCMIHHLSLVIRYQTDDSLQQQVKQQYDQEPQPINNHHLTRSQILGCSRQCTMALSPCKMGNREFQSDYHHRPHFLAVQLFQTEIFGDCQLHSFTFEKYLGTS